MWSAAAFCTQQMQCDHTKSHLYLYLYLNGNQPNDLAFWNFLSLGSFTQKKSRYSCTIRLRNAQERWNAPYGEKLRFFFFLWPQINSTDQRLWHRAKRNRHSFRNMKTQIDFYLMLSVFCWVAQTGAKKKKKNNKEMFIILISLKESWPSHNWICLMVFILIFNCVAFFICVDFKRNFPNSKVRQFVFVLASVECNHLFCYLYRYVSNYYGEIYLISKFFFLFLQKHW